MEKLAVGLLAHVDAGKTTLSEALLYRGGAIRSLGRVDHADAFLDTDAMERERGITIFSKQALLPLENVEITLLDTPGHVDFCAEMERVLQVLDYAVLVISGSDGVQGHTHTLWRLLERYAIPTFLFINKMDQPGANREGLLAEVKSKLSAGCLDFGQADETLWEQAALCDEGALERYLDAGWLSQADLAALIARRQVFPCFFGAALKLEGVDALLEGLRTLTRAPARLADFGARVFKVSRDPQGARLTWMKITGGELRVKSPLSGGRGEAHWEEKADQLRIYSGAKFQTVDAAPAGTVCAVTGLTKTWPGQGLGAEPEGLRPALEAVLTYRLLLPEGCDPALWLPKLRQLEEEDPQLRILWKSQLREIHIQLMGQVQQEVLKRLISERFGLEVEFGAGSIIYRETIAGPVEGIGHYEPLRHYAEVHLLLEPGAPGSGLQVASACSTDALDINWQRLILTHLLEREHPGVLSGAPITDMKITLVAGRAHLKHTEGGDFRQATYRAVRQGLMQAESVLLEPWYRLRLELPESCLGRAMTDVQRMGGETESQEHLGEEAVLLARVPVSAFGDYQVELAAYTKGRGRVSCTAGGYRPCPDQAAVLAALGYDPARDIENPADSVFCSHGAGEVVPWDQVRERAHVDSGLRLGQERQETDGPQRVSPPRPVGYAGTLAEDKELQAIFERTYGKTEPRTFQTPPRPARQALAESYTIRDQKPEKEYLLVDGYNVIFAWEELSALAQDEPGAARQRLMDILSNYQGLRQCELILVFDAYKVKGNPGSVEKYHNIHVVYTKEAETADNYIERVTLELGKKHRVRVVTSDYLEQLIILGHGALRVSARAFREEIQQARQQIESTIRQAGEQSRALSRLDQRAKVTEAEKPGPPAGEERK